MHNFTYTDTMVFGLLGDVYLCIHTQGVKPTPEDWTAFVTHVEANIKKIRVAITYAGNVGPNSLQREEISNMWERVGDVVPCVVMTDELTVRGIIKAVSFFMRKPLKAMSTKELDAACDYLMVKRGDRVVLRGLIETHTSKAA